jgi:hypothetical protein
MSLLQVPRYDAHVAYVTAPPSAPCLPEQWPGPAPVYSEVVVFENAAILPRFILSLDVP